MEEELASEHVQHAEASFTAAAKQQNREVPVQGSQLNEQSSG